MSRANNRAWREVRISSSTLGSALVVGDIALEASARTAHMQENLVHLTRKEFALLQYLMLHRGRVITRDILLASVWGEPGQYGLRTVDVYIRRLRVKLALSARCRIETVVNVGYKLVVEGTE